MAYSIGSSLHQTSEAYSGDTHFVEGFSFFLEGVLVKLMWLLHTWVGSGICLSRISVKARAMGEVRNRV